MTRAELDAAAQEALLAWGAWGIKTRSKRAERVAQAMDNLERAWRACEEKDNAGPESGVSGAAKAELSPQHSSTAPEPASSEDEALAARLERASEDQHICGVDAGRGGACHMAYSMEQAAARIRSLRAEMAQARARISELESQPEVVSQLEDELKAARAELAEGRAIYKDALNLQAKLDQLRAEVERINKGLALVEDDRQAWIKECNESVAERDRLLRILSEAELPRGEGRAEGGK